MEEKARGDEQQARIAGWLARLGYLTSTLDAKPLTQHERNVDDYARGEIAHDEYERREGARLADLAGRRDT